MNLTFWEHAWQSGSRLLVEFVYSAMLVLYDTSLTILRQPKNRLNKPHVRLTPPYYGFPMTQSTQKRHIS